MANLPPSQDPWMRQRMFLRGLGSGPPAIPASTGGPIIMGPGANVPQGFRLNSFVDEAGFGMPRQGVVNPTPPPLQSTPLPTRPGVPNPGRAFSNLNFATAGPNTYGPASPLGMPRGGTGSPNFGFNAAKAGDLRSMLGLTEADMAGLRNSSRTTSGFRGVAPPSALPDDVIGRLGNVNTNPLAGAGGGGAGGGGGTPPPAAAGAAGGGSGAGRGGGTGAGAGSGAGTAGAAGPANNYSAFRGRFGSFRDPLQATGRVGSKLPGYMTAPRSFGGAWATSPKGGFMTKPLTGKANLGAGLATGIALSALPGALTNSMGVDPTSYGARSAQGIGNASALGLMAGAPVSASVGLGVAGADALAAPGGPVRDAINTARGWMGMGPTNDTSLEALANGAESIPYVGDAISGFLGGSSGAGEEQQEPTGPAPLPPTPESVAEIATVAGLQDSSISDLQNMYSSNLALMRAQYQANPEGFAAAVTQAYNANLPEGAEQLSPEQVTDEYLQQSAFQSVVDFLPSAVEQQSARNAMLSNALMYQTAISDVMAPEYDRWNALSSQAAALGNQELAMLYQARPGFMADQLRMQPMLDSVAGAQSFNDQVAQQIQAAEISNAAAAQRPDLFGQSGGADLNSLLTDQLLTQ